MLFDRTQRLLRAAAVKFIFHELLVLHLPMNQRRKHVADRVPVVCIISAFIIDRLAFRDQFDGRAEILDGRPDLLAAALVDLREAVPDIPWGNVAWMLGIARGHQRGEHEGDLES